MSKITLVDNPSITVWYHPDKRLVHHQMHKFVYGDDFREALLAGTKALREHRLTKWLSDDRGNTVLRQEDLDWGQTHWLPQTLRAGWKHWAIVRPYKILAQMGMDRLVKEYTELGLNTRFFQEPDEAMDWLVSQ
jgi:hypothetical protein